MRLLAEYSIVLATLDRSGDLVSTELLLGCLVMIESVVQPAGQDVEAVAGLRSLARTSRHPDIGMDAIAAAIRAAELIEPRPMPRCLQRCAG